MSYKATTRRDFLKTTAKTITSLGLGLSCSNAIANNEVLKIGYLPITDASPILIAYAKGFYQMEGIRVEKPLKIRNWSTLAESFISQKFNLTHLLFPIPVWMRFNNKFPIKVVALNHINGSAITVSHDSNIKSFKDLGGKQIAVPHWYSMHNIILQMGLKKVGLKPVIQDQSKKLKSDEVNLFILPPPDMPSSLVAKKIDGYIVAEPFNALAELKIKAKILRFTGDIWKNHPCCVVVMNENFINYNPEFTQKVVNAIVKAQAWINKNPIETAKLLSRQGSNFLPVNTKTLVKVFTGYEKSIYGKGAIPQAIKHSDWAIKRIGFEPYPYPSATRFIINEMRNTIVEGNTSFLTTLDTDKAINELVDDRFVKKAMLAYGINKFDSINIEDPWVREEIIEI